MLPLYPRKGVCLDYPGLRMTCFLIKILTNTPSFILPYCMASSVISPSACKRPCACLYICDTFSSLHSFSYNLPLMSHAVSEECQETSEQAGCSERLQRGDLQWVVRVLHCWDLCEKSILRRTGRVC